MNTERFNPICRILCPTDFSPASDAAFEYAERLAACTGADLIVLHAQQGSSWADPAGQADKTTEALSRIQTSLSGVHVKPVVYSGPPGEVICWAAQELDCDQIVMGTHGRSGLFSMLMGSVTEYVVRNARCPVLTVRVRPEKEPLLKKPEEEMVLPPIQAL